MNYILLFILWVGYGLDGPRFESQQEREIFFSSSQRPYRLWGPPSSLFNEYQGLFPLRPGSEADHSRPPIYKVKNEWSYTSAPPISLHNIDGYIFTLSCWEGNFPVKRGSVFFLTWFSRCCLSDKISWFAIMLWRLRTLFPVAKRRSRAHVVHLVYLWPSGIVWLAFQRTETSLEFQ